MINKFERKYFGRMVYSKRESIREIIGSGDLKRRNSLAEALGGWQCDGRRLTSTAMAYGFIQGNRRIIFFEVGNDWNRDYRVIELLNFTQGKFEDLARENGKTVTIELGYMKDGKKKNIPGTRKIIRISEMPVDQEINDLYRAINEEDFLSTMTGNVFVLRKYFGRMQRAGRPMNAEINLKIPENEGYGVRLMCLNRRYVKVANCCRRLATSFEALGLDEKVRDHCSEL